MVKCSECGLLGFRNFRTLQIDEAIESIRSGGPFPLDLARTGYNLHDRVPICVQGAFPLLRETMEAIMERGVSVLDAVAEGRNPGLPDVMAVIGKERSCTEFTEWQQGSSPKEHREMMDRKWMEEREERRDEAARNWQRDESRSNRKFRIAEFVVAVVGVVVLVMAVLIGRNQTEVRIITPDTVSGVESEVDSDAKPSTE